MYEEEVGKTDLPQIITIVIFAISYILIFSGRLDRSAAALLGLFMMVSAGYIFGFFRFEDLLIHVDWDVVILLFGMMTYVGLMAKTGFFKYIGIKAIKLSKGNPWLIFLYLSLITTFISMIIDNVTTILLVIPLTVEVAEMLDINPIPIMLGESILSNVGGVGTMVGDPPNIMIAFASGFNFNDFVVHLFPPVLTALFISTLLGKIIYRKWLREKPKNIEELMKLEEFRYIKNKRRMRFYLYILFGMIVLFATESYTGISAAFIALAGGITALIISREEPREAFKAVEWSTLVFFIALFALVGGLQETGVLKQLAGGIASISSNVILTSIIILWVAGLSSSFVDNIPITAAFIPIVSSLALDYNSGLLWWALAMGVGMGGNITPIGSSAGVITLSLSKRYGHNITNREWLKFGTITGIASMTVCTLFLLIIV
ncbi:MAG TPA: citrate transporter [Thermoplasmatales archaeon]|nr:MAG: ArsB/NhaD family transporter [Thermoplasmata archaeon]RLF50169.1 MAG: citrate transporter [Thermoplasmata archaeon]HDO70015.1 citrate transporter [Thermoplasmatales archaeon]HEX08379.1 citrate transporter [Thermoplasmatales archaeon]